MKNKAKIIKAVGFAGMLLGCITTLVTNWYQQESMEMTIEEKVNEAFAKKMEKESE